MSKMFRLCGEMYDGGLLGKAGTTGWVIVPDKPSKRVVRAATKPRKQAKRKRVSP